MQRAIDNLTTAAQMRNGDLELRLEDANMLRVVRKAIDLGSAREDQFVSIIETGDPCDIRCDPTRVSLAVANLIAHAASRTAQDGPIRVDMCFCHRRVMISVADDGSPLTDDDLDNLISRSEGAALPHEADAADPGFGLYVADAIAKAHGGSVRLDPAGSGGMSITIDVPSAEG